jgi:hypothetical protein
LAAAGAGRPRVIGGELYRAPKPWTRPKHHPALRRSPFQSALVEAATLEFNPDLGRQIVPIVMKIFDNFLLDVKDSRLQYRIQEAAPHGMIVAPPPDSTYGCCTHGHCHGDLPLDARQY